MGAAWPPDNTFCSVQKESAVPQIDIVDINEYFLRVYKGQEGMSMYSAVHRKGFNMMKENFLISLIQSVDKNLFFYRGQVNSEMTKSLTYFVRLIINLEGSILEGNCECIAGKGNAAICKHVATVLYAILKFKECGTWFIRKTCTEVKQIWHMPKRSRIDVSPKKAEQLDLTIDAYNSKKKRKQNVLVCYDPRPVKYRNDPSFNDNVRNAVINYNSTNRRTLAISGAFPVASVTGLANDHDYLKKPLTHQFIWNRIQVNIFSF